MKIKTKKVSLETALAIKPQKKKKLRKPSRLFSALIRLLSIPDLVATKFSFDKEKMELAGKGPFLILMNHSSFIDLKIASKIFFPKRYYIVMTTDGMVGKEWLMRAIGCIPTQKFVPDVSLIMDIKSALEKQKTSVLMFPEAGYSFDGTSTTLPKKLGGLLKKLNVPVLSVITDGAYLRQPLYNNLKIRKVKTSAKLTLLLTKEEIASKSVEELDEIINKTFTFDNFMSQRQNGVKIKETKRAEGLNKILYRCPNCNSDSKMESKDAFLTCSACGKTYKLNEDGSLKAEDGVTEFKHIPDWYSWERECVKKEIESGNYKLDLDVDIAILNDTKALYMVGEGKLIHDNDGFTLTHSNGQELFKQAPTFSHSLNADFYWYEIGDVICIGNKERLFYCFPKQKDVVTKARLATEELYKMLKK